MVAAAALGLAGVALAPVAVATPSATHFNFKVPMTISTNVTSDSYCDNTGPHITFGSVLSLGDHSVQMKFSNNTIGTHSVDAYATAALGLSQGGAPGGTVFKQPSLGGAGGNPFIYYQDDTSGSTYYLGRCVQDFGAGHDNGRGPFTNQGSLGAFTDMTVQSLACSNRGSSLAIGTNSGAANPTGHLLLTNNYVALKGKTPHVDPTDIAASVNFTLVGTNKVAKQGNVGGPGGNPLISVLPGTGTGTTFKADLNSTPAQLGRCNQLG